MGLDYSQGCVNFRDVGEFVNLIANRRLLSEKRLLRGGKLDSVQSADDICNPGTIINLRKSAETILFEAITYNFPISNDYEKYDTSNREVQRWLNKVIGLFEDETLRYPVLIHCTSGKDRTGVVVAALLRVLEIPEEIIVAEYLLSDGEVREQWIKHALAGINNPVTYFSRVNLNRVRTNILQVES